VPAGHVQHPGTLKRGRDHTAHGLGDEPGSVADTTEVPVRAPFVACVVRHRLLATAGRVESPWHSQTDAASDRLARSG
jgi:hypothetical protein